jgi:transcriptional regulator with GAF, ATPase, and Fis domain/CheY-like chemotaxis protein
MASLPLIELPLGEVLVTSPSSSARGQVVHSFGHPGRAFEEAVAGAEALGKLEQRPWKLLLLDRQLPDVNAAELRAIIRQRAAAPPVLLLHRQRNAPSYREGSRYHDGRSPEILTQSKKPAWLPPAPGSAGSPGQRVEIQPLPGMVGRSVAIQKVYRLARLVAARDTTVLITGATGTGKELVARAIHQLSPRNGRPFSVVNCAAIPEALLESELFGYMRGAFTGAVQSQMGRVHAAQGGTLFLDEIGEMPLSLQAKLLRFLEQKEIQRLGSAEVLRVDVRVVAASNADLARRVTNREFREDLYYRLASFPIELPPLTDRISDVLPLAQHFLAKLSGESGVGLSAEAALVLQKHTWPGNVRELQFVVERACILAEAAQEILPEHIVLPRSSGSGRAVQAIGRAVGI